MGLCSRERTLWLRPAQRHQEVAMGSGTRIFPHAKMGTKNLPRIGFFTSPAKNLSILSAPKRPVNQLIIGKITPKVARN